MVQTASKKAKRPMSRLERKNTLIAYSFLAPNFLGFAIFTLVPVVCSVLLSFVEWNGGAISNMKWVGLQNYASIFKVDKVAEKLMQGDFFYFFERVDLGIALKNTIFYTVVTVPLTLICAVALAIALNKAVKGAVGFRAVFFFPYVASMVAICVCWNFMLMKDGPVNQLIQAFGIPFNKSWTADSTMAIWAIILVSVWRNMGYYMVIYLAGLQGTNPELEEAAELDGASKWQIFWNVTLPQLKPTTFFVIIMLTIASFKVYDQMYMITQGGPGNATMTLVYYIYNVAFVNTPKYGYASAVSMVLFVLVLFVTIIQFKGSSSND